MPCNFALTGVGGYIAPRHLKAIRDTGNLLVAATDPKDSVGLLDQFGFETGFFTEFERFDRHLEKLRRGPEEQRVHYLSICSPNYLHDAHCRAALRVGAHAICEKPLVINPWNLAPLEELEAETNRRIYNVLQLRVHPTLMQLREALLRERSSGKQHDVVLTYITARGPWYHVSWKGQLDKSGGVATNIGIHFFDLLLWLFGPAGEYRVHHADTQRMTGFLELEHARVRWFLSLDHRDLPFTAEPGKRTTFRSITIDGQELEFTEGFSDLHTRIYEEVLAGRGFGIADARPSIELVYNLRTVAPNGNDDGLRHPLLTNEKR
ncbi:Gfo/Idh/MocA family oxidoreductase [Candidatus Viridilinea mediisalina]|uniref:Oxidoreductase n=1 Tax=Candidatus Viridilinea mediisalina TaxID=2024553 RepID=A0A2A6RL88_9CHLR|nr:Gfo/Idh/MocA family oxidoreductase [Candidatus Viridilinea mediisalina]PDW03610.1 oxidoreductase [Candidatus Viridilinea mediisalina]